MDLFEDQEEELKYGIMFSISVPLAFRTQGFATRTFLGTTTGALSPKQNVSYEYTVSPIAQRNVIPLGFYCIRKKYQLRYYFFPPCVFFLDSKNPLICLNAYKVLYFWYVSLCSHNEASRIFTILELTINTNLKIYIYMNLIQYLIDLKVNSVLY